MKGSDSVVMCNELSFRMQSPSPKPAQRAARRMLEKAEKTRLKQLDGTTGTSEQAAVDKVSPGVTAGWGISDHCRSVGNQRVAQAAEPAGTLDDWNNFCWMSYWQLHPIEVTYFKGAGSFDGR